MVQVQKSAGAELDLQDEDYFEEFDLDLPKDDVDMGGDDKKKADAAEVEDEIYGEAEKWDDDDIEEDFSMVLKKELKMETTEDLDIDAIAKQEIANREEKRLKRKHREEALAKKEQELLNLDKVLDLKRNVYASYALEPVDPAAQRRKPKETKEEDTGNEAVETYFKNLEGVPDCGVIREEFVADLKPSIYKKKDIALAQQRDNLQEKDKELQKKAKQLAAESRRFIRNRSLSVAKLVGEGATEDQIAEKTQEETVKVMETRQNKRRRAAFLVAKDKAKNAKKTEEMDKVVLAIAKEVAFAEAVEEQELLTSQAARPSSAAPKKCLPYKVEKGDDIDAAVGKALTKSKSNVGFKLIKGKTVTNPPNTRSYYAQSGNVVSVKSIFNVVLANDGSGGAWCPLEELVSGF